MHTGDVEGMATARTLGWPKAVGGRQNTGGRGESAPVGRGQVVCLTQIPCQPWLSSVVHRIGLVLIRGAPVLCVVVGWLVMPIERGIATQRASWGGKCRHKH